MFKFIATNVLQIFLSKNNALIKKSFITGILFVSTF